MKPFAQQTYYELLEVPVTAQMEEIRAAYARLMELYAPDSIAVYALVESDQVDALRARMTEAMEILTDSDLRVEYDKDLGIAPPATARAAAALASAAEPPEASAKEAKKAAEAPVLTGPEAFRASFVSGYSLSYVTSSLQVAPLGGGLVDVPAALVRPDAEAPREPGPGVPTRTDAPVKVEEPVVAPPVEPATAESAVAPKRSDEAPTSSDAVTDGKGTAPLATEVPKSEGKGTAVLATEVPKSEEKGTAALATETPKSEAAASVSPSGPVAPPSTRAVETPKAEVAATDGKETASLATEALNAEVAAAGASPTVPAASPSSQVAETPKSEAAASASPAAPVAPLSTQAAETPKPTDATPSSATPPAHVVESPAAPAAVTEAPRPSVAASPSTTVRGPAPTEPSTSIVVASAPERGTSASAQARSGDASLSSAEPSAGQVAARTRDVRPRLPDIPSDAEFNGELLRRVREARGYTLHQVADRTRISSRHLENVEADRYTALPAQVYLRGILMNLARELGLDPLRVSKSYLALASEKSGKR
ncbi:helix-turn-helix domain-containing protein [Myxococcus stipitatus]|uniref:helix-turn-helix domain-containing protein n=1 Tax=Myxococcus stipitatus TaxID=83455 RepID=UPI0031450B22